MVLVLEHRPADLLELLLDGGRGVVAEAMFLVPEPVAHGDREAESLGLVEILLRVAADAPSTERIAPALG